jgi:hypothetical protein
MAVVLACGSPYGRAPAGDEPDDPDTTTSAAADPESCPEIGGTAFAGHCYFVVDEGDLAESRAACSAKGAHLVSITSAAEQDHVASLAKVSTWIGLTSTTTGTTDPSAYGWVTGEPSPVAFWHPGQPNGGRGCVVSHYTDRLWRDVQCTNTYPAICERD